MAHNKPLLPIQDLDSAMKCLFYGGGLIVSGLAVGALGLFTYNRELPVFDDFELLRRHLLEKAAKRYKGTTKYWKDVGVEGTIKKLDQNVLQSERSRNDDELEGVVRYVQTMYGSDWYLSSENETPILIPQSFASIPFKLVDKRQSSMIVIAANIDTITPRYSATNLHQMAHTLRMSWGYLSNTVTVADNDVSTSAPMTREYMLTFGTEIGISGCACIQGNTVVFIPDRFHRHLTAVRIDNLAGHILGSLMGVFGVALILGGITLPLFARHWLETNMMTKSSHNWYIALSDLVHY